MSSWVQILVASVAASVAYLQWRVAQNKLKLDLFDRRHAIYRAVAEHLSAIAQDGRVLHEQNTELLRRTRDAQFLFDVRIKRLIDAIYGLCLDLETVGTPANMIYEPAARDEAIRLKGILRDRLKALPEEFRPYLHLSHEVILVPRWLRGLVRRSRATARPQRGGSE